MHEIVVRLEQVRERIRQAEREFGRPADSVRLLAVSKTRAADEIRVCAAAGQVAFGENYLQEALEKIEELRDLALEWHFIGRLQGNKTRPVAENFAWVHGIERLKHAERLSQQRPDRLPPLQVCLQVKIDPEDSKGGLDPTETAELISAVGELPRLQLRGLMTLPAPSAAGERQRRPFRLLRELRDRLASPELPLDTLSMGMSGDLEAAIAEGATLVRVGTALFGPRN